MSPLRGVGGRLALALLVVVACVLAIVYVIVVPSYQRSLENSELRSLESSMRTVAIPTSGSPSSMRVSWSTTSRTRCR